MSAHIPSSDVLSHINSENDDDLQNPKFVQTLNKRLECGVCKGKYKTPRRLLCDHSFCEACLKELTEYNFDGIIKCPACREITRLPLEGVTGLKKNLDLIGLADDVADHKASVKKQRFAMCETHQELKKLFCKTYNKAICNTCKHTKEHNGHDDFTLQEHIQHLTNEAESQFSKIKRQKNKITQANAHINKLQEVSQFQKNESIEEIEKEEKWVLEVIKRKYDRLKQKIQISNDEVAWICNKKIEENHAEEEYIEDRRKELKSLKELAKSQLDESVSALDQFIAFVGWKEMKIQERSEEDERKVLTFNGSFVGSSRRSTASRERNHSIHSINVKMIRLMMGHMMSDTSIQGTPVSDEELSSIVRLLVPFKTQMDN